MSVKQTVKRMARAPLFDVVGVEPRPPVFTFAALVNTLTIDPGGLPLLYGNPPGMKHLVAQFGLTVTSTCLGLGLIHLVSIRPSRNTPSLRTGNM
jgi:hypothetical protein